MTRRSDDYDALMYTMMYYRAHIELTTTCILYTYKNGTRSPHRYTHWHRSLKIKNKNVVGIIIIIISKRTISVAVRFCIRHKYTRVRTRY